MKKTNKEKKKERMKNPDRNNKMKSSKESQQPPFPVIFGSFFGLSWLVLYFRGSFWLCGSIYKICIT
jgi:hypothetical protein